MIRHVVLFRLRRGISVDDSRVRAACAAERLLESDGGAGHVDTVSWHFAADVSRRPVSADFVGVGYFPSQDHLTEFLDSALHRDAVAAWEGLADIVIADAELPD